MAGVPAIFSQQQIMKTTYISGPMSDLPDLNFPAFHEAAHKLRALGHRVINPAEINTGGELTWQQCMRADIRALCDCHVLALLPGWERSKGAHLELHLAHRLGLEITTVADLLAAAAS